MCIFSQPVVSVTDTNIFARLLPDGWQYLVYQMNFESVENNAIILPLPVQLPSQDEGTLEFISLEDYDGFFIDLNRGFPLRRPPSRFGAIGVDSAVPDSVQNLVVHDVGDFVASFVPTLSDFHRLDEQFRLDPQVWKKMPSYADYGFAVFQLKTGKGKPHPMAFKFRSRLSDPQTGSLFFPTVHIHDGEVHARESFDHTLFLQAPEFDEVCGEYHEKDRLQTDHNTGYVRSKWKANEFLDVKKSRGILAKDGLIHRLEMRGKLKNADVLAKRDLSHVVSRFPLLGAAAIACLGGVAGMKWFFQRREQISRERSSGLDD